MSRVCDLCTVPASTSQSNRRRPMQIGFVGLGIMGRPMANNLMKAGHQLFVYGKRTVPPEIREGAKVCDTLKAVAEAAEVAAGARSDEARRGGGAAGQCPGVDGRARAVIASRGG